MSDQTSSAAYGFNPTSTEAVTVPPQALLAQILPYLSQTASVLLSAFRLLIHTFGFLISKISYPILVLSPLPIILYLFSPVIVFAQVTLNVLVSIPFHISLYLLDAFYPVYVFFGVACIVGALVGLSGRLVALVLVDMAVGPVKPETRQLEPSRAVEKSNVKG